MKRSVTSIALAGLLAAALTTACTERDTAARAAPAGESARDARGAFTLLATGDIIPYPSIIRQARSDADGGGIDFRRILAGVKPLVSAADVAICHQETPYAAPDGPFTGYPLFRSPPQIAAALRDTGYDSCSTSSNHTLDDGFPGVRRTLDALDTAGVAHAGSARSAKEAGRPARLRAGGAQIAHLAYTYGTNGIRVPADKPWLVNLIDPDRIIEDARAARRAGADVVVVSMHWGTEWQEAPDSQQLSLAKRLTAARSDGRRDIDLILGTHAHVPQAYEKVNDTWVVYGMGDQVAGVMNDPRGSMGSAARFAFTPPAGEGEAWKVKKAEFIPHLMASKPRFRLVNLPRALADGATDAAYVRARNTVRNAALSRGAANEGLVMGE